MTLEELLDRESIRQTMVNYTIAGDRLRADEFVAVFTEDAVLESEGVPESDAFRYEGLEAIREWITRWSRPAEEAPASKRTLGRASEETQPATEQATFVRHHLSTCQIELASVSVAKARTYWVAYTDIGPDHGGYYLDALRKVGDRWLIAHRRVRLDWRSPQSLFTTAVARTR